MNPSLNGHSSGDGNETLREMVRGLHDKMDKHMDKQEVYNKRSERIQSIVLGDPEAGIDGLVHKVSKHGKWISLDKKMKIAATAAVTSGGAGWAGWEYIKKILTSVFS